MDTLDYRWSAGRGDCGISRALAMSWRARRMPGICRKGQNAPQVPPERPLPPSSVRDPVHCAARRKTGGPGSTASGPRRLHGAVSPPSMTGLIPRHVPEPIVAAEPAALETPCRFPPGRPTSSSGPRTIGNNGDATMRARASGERSASRLPRPPRSMTEEVFMCRIGASSFESCRQHGD